MAPLKRSKMSSDFQLKQCCPLFVQYYTWEKCVVPAFNYHIINPGALSTSKQAFWQLKHMYKIIACVNSTIVGCKVHQGQTDSFSFAFFLSTLLAMFEVIGI
jgi:hypothetical protein